MEARLLAAVGLITVVTHICLGRYWRGMLRAVLFSVRAGTSFFVAISLVLMAQWITENGLPSFPTPKAAEEL
jgi:hypothetical protein